MKTLHVVAALIVKGPTVLIARRLPGGAAGGLWEFPGGKVNPNEHPKAALVREIQEELGIKITVGESAGCYCTTVADRIIALDCYFATASTPPQHLVAHDDWRMVEVTDLSAFEMPAPDLPVVAYLQSLPALPTNEVS